MIVAYLWSRNVRFLVIVSVTAHQLSHLISFKASLLKAVRV